MKFPWQKKPGRAIRRGQKPDSAKRLILKRIGVGVLIAAVVSVLLAVVWYGTRLPGVTISVVTVSGGETIDHEILKRDVEDVLRGTYWLLVPKSFSPLIPEREITEVLYQHDRVATVMIENERTEVSVTIEEFVPHALWCDAVGSTNCMFMDSTGYAFQAAPSLSGGSFLRYVEAERELTKEVQAFTNEFITTTESFADLLSGERGFEVALIEITKDRDVVYHLASGARFVTSPELSPQTSFENLLTVLDAPDFAHLTADNFEYIDLRFGNKVYVQEVKPEVATSTASTSDDTSL